MAAAFMAYPELRNPFASSSIHSEGSVTVLYEGRQVELAEHAAGKALLIRPDDLININGFEVKPEGVCHGDLCIPLTTALLVEQDDQTWFDLTAFADLLEQPYVADHEARVWSFAEIPAKRHNMMTEAMAPSLELTDRQGNIFNITDLKGKKALIVTWSSW